MASWDVPPKLGKSGKHEILEVAVKIRTEGGVKLLRFPRDLARPLKTDRPEIVSVFIAFNDGGDLVTRYLGFASKSYIRALQRALDYWVQY